MPYYSNYSVKGVHISDILEEADNRNHSSEYFSGYNSENKSLSFATYVPSVHPFNYNTNINEYYSNKFTGTNKGYIPKGYAPTLIPRFESSRSDGGAEITIYYKNNSDDKRSGNGVLNIKIKHSDGTQYSKVIEECPACIIIGLIGAGGGGAGGGGWWTGKEAFGGGCAAFAAVHIELPWASKNEFVPVVRMNLGNGGTGGNAWSNGAQGGASTFEFYFSDTRTWKKCVSIEGGKGGRNIPIDAIYSPTTELAISKAEIDSINNQILGQTGYGRITITNSVRNWSWGSGAFSYMPGNYFDPSRDDRYNQINRSFGRLSSGLRQDNSFVYGNYSRGGHYDKYTTIAKVHNRWWNGKSSVYGACGSISETGNGGNGGIGAGGGAGCSSANIFDTKIGNGGNGGPAGFKIYW